MPEDAKADSLHEKGALYRSSAVPTPELIDELYREEVRDARRMPPERKLLAGEELFYYACSITLAGIQNQFPDADEPERRRILEERLRLGERLEGRT
jgi:hypothetical protein